MLYYSIKSVGIIFSIIIVTNIICAIRIYRDAQTHVGIHVQWSLNLSDLNGNSNNGSLILSFMKICPAFLELFDAYELTERTS
jgi:hypothetical protein